MKNPFLLLAFLFLAATFQNLLIAQTEETTRSLGAFNGIKVSNGIEATLVKGDKHEITITATALDLDKVTTNVKDRVLDLSISGSSPRASSVKATITYIEIDEIHASTSSKVFIKDPISAKVAAITAVTSAYVEAEVKAQQLEIDGQTSARISLKGESEHLNLQLFTNAEFDGKGLTTDHAEIRANTNARGEFSVKESVKGTAATRARITYFGNPNIVDVKSNTGGSIDGE
jgi:hypothetical protein